jgi:hypothetical protein
MGCSMTPVYEMGRKAVRLLVWNIQHGGGARLARIVEDISAYGPDVIALTEFRARPGVALCAAMKERRLPHVETGCVTAGRWYGADDTPRYAAAFARTNFAELFL